MAFLLQFSHTTEHMNTYLEKQTTVVRIEEERQNNFDLWGSKEALVGLTKIRNQIGMWPVC